MAGAEAAKAKQFVDAGASLTPAARRCVASGETPRREQTLDHYFAQDRLPDREFYNQRQPMRRMTAHQFDPLGLEDIISDIAADILAACKIERAGQIL